MSDSFITVDEAKRNFLAASAQLRARVEQLEAEHGIAVGNAGRELLTNAETKFNDWLKSVAVKGTDHVGE